MEINKCEFCEKYYPVNKGGTRVCNASNYSLQYDNACSKALDRMMAVLTVERCKEGGSDHVINFN